MNEGNWRAAVAHACKAVPGAKYVATNPEMGPAHLLEYVVDMYLDCNRRFTECMKRYPAPYIIRTAEGENGSPGEVSNGGGPA